MDTAEKKKILFVVTKGNFGGAQRYVYDLASSLPKDKYEVLVAFGIPGILKTKLEQAAIRVIEIPTLERNVSLLQDIRAFSTLLSLVRRERPDIVHLNSSKVGALGALASRLAGIKKIIFSVHGFAFHEDRPWIQRIGIRCISWMTLVLATQNIFVSETEKRQAERWPLIKNKLHLIHNGIRPPHFMARNTAREKISGLVWGYNKNGG